MAVTLPGLAVSLQAVTRVIEQSGHQGAAHLVALLLRRFGQSPRDHHYNTWHEKLVVNPYFTLSKVDSLIFRQALSFLT